MQEFFLFDKKKLFLLFLYMSVICMYKAIVLHMYKYKQSLKFRTVYIISQQILVSKARIASFIITRSSVMEKYQIIIRYRFPTVSMFKLILQYCHINRNTYSLDKIAINPQSIIIKPNIHN